MSKPNIAVAGASLTVSLCVLLLGAVRCASPSDAPGSGATRLAESAPHPTTKATAGRLLAASAMRGGDLHPYARPELDVGRMAPGTRLEGMSLLFRMTASQSAAAANLAHDQGDPLSPHRHHWITASQYAASFGASPEIVARTTGWLAAQGFTVHGLASTGARLFFSGTVGQLEAAFGTEMHRYDVRGEHHFALAVQPTYPAELAPSILGLRGVHDFRMKPMIRSASKKPPQGPDDILGYPSDAASGGAWELLTLAPADFAAIYDVNALYAEGVTGTGQTIAIVGESDYNDADIVAFRTHYGLDSSNLPTRDFVTYSGKPVYSYDAFGEAELDLEWSGAVARDAKIYFVFTGDNPTYDVWDAVAYAIEKGTYPLISASFGGCEEYFTPNETIFLSTMGDAASMQGTTIVNSSGDWGAAACDFGLDLAEVAAEFGPSVSWPASIPSFVAVGGTELDWGGPPPPTYIETVGSVDVPYDEDAAVPFATYWSCTGVSPAVACSANGYVPETGWNEIQLQIADNNYFWGASGGGQSILYPMPYWQIGQATGSTRQVPDVALSAAWYQVGYMVSTSWTAADGSCSTPYPQTLNISGGTSAAAPSFAGILALVTQAIQQANPSWQGGLGNANPVLYALNASTRGTAAPAFHDVSTGDNIVPCAPSSVGCPGSPPYQFGFSAGPGYDMVTGLGSVDAFNLAVAWATLAPTVTQLTVTPSGTTEGSNVALTATVSSSATSNPLSGSVLFYMESVGPEGEAGAVAELSLLTAAAVTPTTGSYEGATASTSLLALPGRLDSATIVAFYAGDDHYLASWSTPSAVTATSSFAAVPTGGLACSASIRACAITLGPDQPFTFTTTGGVAPVQWAIERDTTWAWPDGGSYQGATVSSHTATSASFRSGPLPGTTVVAGIDADGAELRITVTVPGTSDGGTSADAGSSSSGSGAASSSGSSQRSGASSAVNSASSSAGGTASGSSVASSSAGGTASGSSVASSSAGSAGTGGSSASASRSSSGTLSTMGAGDASDEGGASSTAGPSSGCSCTTAAGMGGGPIESLGSLLLGFSLAARRHRSRVRLRT